MLPADMTIVAQSMTDSTTNANHYSQVQITQTILPHLKVWKWPKIAKIQPVS